MTSERTAQLARLEAYERVVRAIAARDGQAVTGPGPARQAVALLTLIRARRARLLGTRQTPGAGDGA